MIAKNSWEEEESLMERAMREVGDSCAITQETKDHILVVLNKTKVKKEYGATYLRSVAKDVETDQWQKRRDKEVEINTTVIPKVFHKEDK